VAADDVLTLPDRLAARPVWSGLPVPYSVPWSGVPDGREGVGVDGSVPDFKGTDPIKWTLIVKGRLCALCGEVVLGYLAFLGGPGCLESGIFTDPGMHEDCARAATRLCPFIGGRKDYSAATKRAAPGPLEGPAVHPAAMFLMLAATYRVAVLGGSPQVIADRPWLHFEQLPKHRPAPRTAAV
jgi:hypothetical protein